MVSRVMILLVSVILTVPFASAQVVTLPDIDISGSPNGIVLLPMNTPSVFTDLFSRYTKIIAPNGKPIHFLAQDDWSDDKIIKAKKVMEHFLTDYPYSLHGSNKEAVANAMSDRKSTMTLYNNSVAARAAREGLRGATDLALQSMWANEITVEGDDDYMNQITRDATFEEVLHLVQRRGIMNALPEYQAKIEAAHEAYLAKGKYDPGDDSHRYSANEYYAAQYDIYLDLWVVPGTRWEGRDQTPAGMERQAYAWSLHVANNRTQLLEADPLGFELLTNFFHPYLTYTPLLPMDFEGTFSIKLDPRLVYTYKSQHLKNVTLRGSNDANLTGNSYDNVLRGNAGNNILQGGRGDDQLFGDAGDDTALYLGTYADYSILQYDGYTTVKDKRVNKDGIDELTSVEYLQFSDRKVKL